MFQFTIANSTLRNIPRFRQLRRRWSFRLFKQSRFILISPFEFLLHSFLYKFLLIDSIRITFYISLTWIRLCSRASFFSLAVSWSFAIWSNFSKSLFKDIKRLFVYPDLIGLWRGIPLFFMFSHLKSLLDGVLIDLFGEGRNTIGRRLFSHVFESLHDRLWFGFFAVLSLLNLFFASFFQTCQLRLALLFKYIISCYLTISNNIFFLSIYSILPLSLPIDVVLSLFSGLNPELQSSIIIKNSNRLLLAII